MSPNGARTARSGRSTQSKSRASSQAREMLVHAGEAARFLKALANEQRLMILCNLLERPLSVSELNDRIPLSQSALSQHLAVLRENGAVQTERQAQTIYYSLTEGPVTEVMSTLHGVFCGR